MDTNTTEGPAEDHYVIVLDVKRVNLVKPKSERSSGYSQNTIEPTIQRTVSSVTKLVIRSKTLEGLVAKATQHLGLIGED